MLKSASGGTIDEGAAVVDREVLSVLGRNGADFVDEACGGSLVMHRSQLDLFRKGRQDAMHVLIFLLSG